MKLGLLTDIHENNGILRLALDDLTRHEVDQVVVLGDLFRTGEHIDDTCRILSAANAVGVWGNHDFGLCYEPTQSLRDRFPASTIDFMTSLLPRLVIEDCHFTHVEPWLNPKVITDLWYYDGPPDKHGKLDRIFRAVSYRMLFTGHFHKWILAKRDTVVDWHAARPIVLEPPERFFVVVGALCYGWWAIYDTTTGELTPRSTDQALSGC